MDEGWIAKHDIGGEPAITMMEPSRGILDVIRERFRQATDEGWTPEHDDKEHQSLELAKAAAAYLGRACNKDATRRSKTFPPGIWPWHRDWWKPADRRRDLVKAAALIIAQIEQLDRAEARAGE